MSYLDLSLGKRFSLPLKLRLRTRLAVWRSRRALARLDARALEDIGITARKAEREVRLSAWDVPANWRDS